MRVPSLFQLEYFKPMILAESFAVPKSVRKVLECRKPSGRCGRSIGAVSARYRRGLRRPTWSQSLGAIHQLDPFHRFGPIHPFGPTHPFGPFRQFTDSPIRTHSLIRSHPSSSQPVAPETGPTTRPYPASSPLRWVLRLRHSGAQCQKARSESEGEGPRLGGAVRNRASRLGKTQMRGAPVPPAPPSFSEATPT